MSELAKSHKVESPDKKVSNPGFQAPAKGGQAQHIRLRRCENIADGRQYTAYSRQLGLKARGIGCWFSVKG